MEKTSWLERLSQNLEQAGGEALRDEVMQGSTGLGSGSAPGTKVRWVCGMLERMAQRLDEETQARVLAACHCAFPQTDIQRYKNLYESTRQIDLLIEAMQASRRDYLQRRVGAEPLLWEMAQAQAYFHSPTRDGNTVLHIGPPYHPWVTLLEQDAQKKRMHNCHCGWINGSKGPVSPVFCSCSAGYIQALWEGVLGRPVKVAVLCTVFSGADDCRFEVILPDDCLG